LALSSNVSEASDTFEWLVALSRDVPEASTLLSEVFDVLLCFVIQNVIL